MFASVSGEASFCQRLKIPRGRREHVALTTPASLDPAWAESCKQTPLLLPSCWTCLSGVKPYPPWRGGLYSIALWLRTLVLPLSPLTAPASSSFNQCKCLVTGFVCILASLNLLLLLLLLFQMLETWVDMRSNPFFLGVTDVKQGVCLGLNWT